MSNDERVDPFASLSQFKPKTANTQPVADAADIEKISKDNGFPSREAQPVSVPSGKRARHKSAEPRVQLNIKVTQACHERFYDMAEERNVRLGDLLSAALDALVIVEKSQAGM
ncbi:stability/partitioning determinant [Pseudomonas sp. LW8]|uniref:stability/partitioning determinant n=1 Tax=Pseudomonas sp. LW8 TaxID=3242677 RepID=UPI0035C10882